MGKRILQLYSDDEDIILAKSRGINLSSLFREVLKLELYNEERKNKTKEEEINILKIKLAKVNSELEIKNKEIESLNKKIKEPKPRYIDTGIKF